jgi:DNA-binding MarR family transcriptional regulator
MDGADGALPAHLEASLRQFGRLSALRPEAWREIDLTMAQFKALLFIGARRSLSVSQLGAALGLRLGAASALVNRLARLGLVVRAENPGDRRQTLVGLAPAGEAVLARAEAHTMAQARAMYRRLSPRGREAWAVAIEEAVRALAAEEDG